MEFLSQDNTPNRVLTQKEIFKVFLSHIIYSNKKKRRYFYIKSERARRYLQQAFSLNYLTIFLGGKQKDSKENKRKVRLCQSTAINIEFDFRYSKHRREKFIRNPQICVKNNFIEKIKAATQQDIDKNIKSLARLALIAKKE